MTGQIAWPFIGQSGWLYLMVNVFHPIADWLRQMKLLVSIEFNYNCGYETVGENMPRTLLQRNAARPSACIDLPRGCVLWCGHDPTILAIRCTRNSQCPSLVEPPPRDSLSSSLHFDLQCVHISFAFSNNKRVSDVLLQVEAIFPGTRVVYNIVSFSRATSWKRWEMLQANERKCSA